MPWPNWGDWFDNEEGGGSDWFDNWFNNNQDWTPDPIESDMSDWGESGGRSLSGEGVGRWDVGTNVDPLIEEFFPEEWDQARKDEWYEDYGMYFEDYDPTREEQRKIQRDIDFDRWNHKINADKRALEGSQGASGFLTSGAARKLEEDFTELSVLENTEAELDYAVAVYIFKKYWENDMYNTLGMLGGMGGFIDEVPSGEEGSWWFGEGSIWDTVTDDMWSVDWWVGDNSLLGQAASFFDDLFSDRRLKKDINLIGRNPSGINIYEFNYKDLKETKPYGKSRYQGAMGDEVPWASKTDPKTGYLKVDYSKIDVEFKRVNNGK